MQFSEVKSNLCEASFSFAYPVMQPRQTTECDSTCHVSAVRQFGELFLVVTTIENLRNVVTIPDNQRLVVVVTAPGECLFRRDSRANGDCFCEAKLSRLHLLLFLSLHQLRRTKFLHRVAVLHARNSSTPSSHVRIESQENSYPNERNMIFMLSSSGSSCLIWLRMSKRAINSPAC